MQANLGSNQIIGPFNEFLTKSIPSTDPTENAPNRSYGDPG